MVYWRDGEARFLEILVSDTRLFVDILPKVLAACLIAAFVAVLMPRQTVMRWVGAESGLLGILIATLAGTICPGGPITIFRLRQPSLPSAQTPSRDRLHHQLDAARLRRILVWELPFFGGEFVIWRTIISLPLPIVAGLLARVLVGPLRPQEQRRGRRRPMIYFVDGLLWVIALGLGLVAASRSRALLRDSVREGVVDCVRLLPRILLGVVGSGYIVSRRCCRRRWSAAGSAPIPASPDCASPCSAARSRRRAGDRLLDRRRSALRAAPARRR